ncbi:MAG: GntR family transcriptional regulator [Methylocystaceae bacterium]
MEFNAAQPIYRQIIDGYKKQLIRGELQPGDKIPSQREYAETVKVNPNTVQRAYREMEVMQMVETQRGQGTFITATPEMLRTMKEEMAAAVVGNFISEMNDLGFTAKEIHQLLEDKLDSSREGVKA